jgi:hypothetical protein
MGSVFPAIVFVIPAARRLLNMSRVEREREEKTMASIVTPTQKARQSATELVIEIMTKTDERVTQWILELMTFQLQIRELGKQANLAIEDTNPTPPANLVRLRSYRDAA